MTTGTWQPALGTGFAALGLAALLDLSRADPVDRVMALGGAAAAGWYLVRGYGSTNRIRAGRRG
ncbi:hypothetical protein ABQE93_25830 [Mycolicibacterium sp. XJ662]